MPTSRFDHVRRGRAGKGMIQNNDIMRNGSCNVLIEDGCPDVRGNQINGGYIGVLFQKDQSGVVLEKNNIAGHTYGIASMTQGKELSPSSLLLHHFCLPLLHFFMLTSCRWYY